MKKGNVVEINGVKQPQLNLPELLDMHRKPLTSEEIKPNMWVWDNKEKQYHLVKSVDWHGIPCWEIVDRYGKYKDFEENRFYRFQPLSEV